jgi:hypothetical protein
MPDIFVCDSDSVNGITVQESMPDESDIPTESSQKNPRQAAIDRTMKP